MAERHRKVLAELSELGLELARALQGRALAAETPEQAERCALAFHRISRSVRQSLALEARLHRDAQRTCEVERTEQVRQKDRRVERRRSQVSAGVERLIWHEAEDAEVDFLMGSLGRLLDEYEEDEDFLTASVETLVARVAAELALEATAAPDHIAPAAEELRRSSA